MCDDSPSTQFRNGDCHFRNSDCGYSSEVEGCDNCSTPSSNEGSEICSDGVCMHEGEECPMAGELSCSECRSVGGSPERKFPPLHTTNLSIPCASDKQHTCRQARNMSSLEDLLANSLTCEHGEEEDGECGISEEEIRMFQANRSSVQQKRLELRETLKRRFQIMRFQRETSPMSSPSSSPSPSPHLSLRFQHQ